MSQIDDFKTLREMNSKLAATSSSTEKKQILAKYPSMKKMLKYTYNPFMKFNITSKNILKYRPEYIQGRRMSLLSRAPYVDVYSLLDALTERKITGNEASDCVLQFIDQYPDYEDEILKMIDKDLKIRVGSSEINKVFPKLIPSFDVALANDYWKAKKNVDFKKDRWFASRKLDGCRCILIEEGGVPTFYSRQGKKFEVLGKLAEAITKIDNWDKFVFDGEICIVDSNGDEDFSSVMKEIRKKDHTIEKPRYQIFDMLTKDEFLSGVSGSIFSQRIDLMVHFADILQNANLTDLFTIVAQWNIRDEEHLLQLSDQATKMGWEGLIIRKDTTYKGKRSNDMLKVKKFFDAEYEVLGIEIGPFRYIDNGAEAEADMVTAVNIKHKGNPVSVGSGFTLEQRRRYMADPSLIVGKEITVQYFEETTNKQGTTSLRFPVVKHVFEDGKRSV